MTTARRAGVPPAPLPPWPLLWAVAYALAVPAIVAGWSVSFAQLSDGDQFDPDVVGSPSFTLLRVFTALGFLPDVLLFLGLLTVLAPRARAVMVERRCGLTRPTRLVLDEIEEFLAAHGAPVEVRANLARAGRLVRVYPADLHRSRIAIFGPFVVLWRRDRRAAEAMLLHEIAHLRTGDQLLLGIGSPFVALVNLWLPLVLVAAVVPFVGFVLIGYPTAVPLGAQLVLLLTEVPRTLLLPVAALWAAELSADLHVAQCGRSADLFRALESQHPAGRRHGRVLVRLSHPPTRLRRWVLDGGTSRDIALLSGWPLVSLPLLVLIIVGAVPAWLLTGVNPADVVALAVQNTGRFLLDNTRVWLPASLILLLWPLVAPRWTGWWSGTRPGPVRIGASSYVTAALAVVATFTLLIVLTV